MALTPYPDGVPLDHVNRFLAKEILEVEEMT
jgi:hypothetical protein